ncbi:MAG: small acid-soluble spore protein SspI [Bacillaceae bacterium]|jgi:small, acid-soluble spore protein I|uniref:Small, acid-soluble spore protein I n=2 Tax=Aeribacillus TaxID=1055323 RepID=A0A165YKD6_9BACI|nr:MULTISPECIES: small acid-soluble spore protein SspI [Aeribacillus]AXI40296.1 small acid-soluble spore protein SspI [Bacillaceae bacterium ZC4]REJ20710.1 MAG: small acid-soluble spore protein SspI [Bacillaceae bacterium]ASS92114.1 small acid-soluble spore protein SspI [Aeribacillus pallidus]AXI40353.1 small acid-soluble spore protein SspI [Bacillaceae bacterium ZC4]KZM56495.1 small acid-soluble spore protein SspI [Aeribacillus pallidus]
MNFDLRNAVIANISQNSKDELRETIVDAINSKEEKMLPGLGVLFEIIWNHSSQRDQQEMVETLEQGLKETGAGK